MTSPNRSLRIVHVTRSLDPADGGLPVVAVRLATAAAEAGHRVTLLHERRGAPDPAYANLPGWPSVARHEITVLPARAGVIGRIGAIDERIADADVVHLHGVWDTVLVAAARSARRFGVPYVVAPHGMLDPWSLSQSRWKKRLALLGPQGHMLNRSARMHALNGDEARLWAPLRLGASAVVIPNGVDLREIPATGGPTHADYFEQTLGVPGCRVVLFLGRLHHKKGLDLLGRAFVRLAADHDCHLVALGPDGGAAEPLRALADQHDLRDRVHLPGPVFGPAKYEALRSAAVFCLPSRQEGFSVATLEAMACGTPVVISRDCHFAEVQPAGCGRVTSLEPEEIAAALSDVLSDPVKRKRMGAAGRQLVEANYTWERATSAALDVYRHVLARQEVLE